jgi:hypothetical protein
VFNPNTPLIAQKRGSMRFCRETGTNYHEPKNTPLIAQKGGFLRFSTKTGINAHKSKYTPFCNHSGDLAVSPHSGQYSNLDTTSFIAYIGYENDNSSNQRGQSDERNRHYHKQQTTCPQCRRCVSRRIA